MPSHGAPVVRWTFATFSFAIYRWLAAFAVVCVTLALGADILYWRTMSLMWVDFSAWLLLVAIVTGCAALPFGAVDFIKRRHTRNRGFAWTHAIVRVLVLLLVFINNLIHASDGWTAVMPWGLTLSALTVLLVVLAGLLGEFHIRANGDRRYA